jgi:chromosome segregation ATPase
MSTILIFHCALWGASLLAGVAVIYVLFKLRLAERYLPASSELQDINAQLPALREECQRMDEAATSHRLELAKLEDEVAPLRQLREWQSANPDAPARLQQVMTDLERSQSELTAVQEKLAQQENRRNEAIRDLQRLTDEKAHLKSEIAGLRKQVATPKRSKVAAGKPSKKAPAPQAKKKRKV